MKKILAKLPSVDLILNQDKMIKLCDQFSRELVKGRCQSAIADMRAAILKGEKSESVTRENLMNELVENIVDGLNKDLSPSLKPVINATGVILHTGLGRAPLSEEARKQVDAVIEGYSNLELDMETGKRGDRTAHVERLLCELTGAESALVVNNNAAAVFIALNTLAFKKEAVISRGQLVEIGGSFRIPEVMEKSGCLMKEVGTTNKTKLSDYENAIGRKTGAVVVAHTSNYRVLGFTAEVELGELVQLCASKKVPLIHDLGAGVLVDLRQFGLPYEPLVQDSVKSGADVITFSGDKVLGGPQAGLIVGKKRYLDRIKKNPIMRAVRCDKMVYAALEATLRLYYSENSLSRNNMTLAMFAASEEEVAKKCQYVLGKIKSNSLAVREEKSESQAGSGALPLEKIPSRALVLSSATVDAEKIAGYFRRNQPPIMGYIQNEEFYLDMRTVLDHQLDEIVTAINRFEL